MSGRTSRENNLAGAFTSSATITLDKLTAEAAISRYGDGEWTVEFDSPNTLSGVKLSFSEGNVCADYKGLSFSVPKSALPVKAMMLELIEAVDTNARETELHGSENDGMLEINGSLEGGDYILTVDGNGNIAEFEMPNNLLDITFKDVTATKAETEETTSAEETVSTAEGE
jgi:hypothetical protein